MTGSLTRLVHSFAFLSRPLADLPLEIFGIAPRRESGDRQLLGRLVLTPDLRQAQVCARLARRVAPHHVGRMPEGDQLLD